jgi:hypothetical protein
MATKDDALKKQEVSLRQTEKEMSEATRTSDGLYSRQGRGKANSTKKERDADFATTKTWSKRRQQRWRWNIKLRLQWMELEDQLKQMAVNQP